LRCIIFDDALKRLLFIPLSLLILITSCKKESCENNIPVVSFKEVQRSLNTTVVVFNVIDCDGDIGLNQTDTTDGYRYNAFVDIRPWQNGDWADKTFDYNDTSYVEIKNDSGVVIGYDTIIDVLNYYYRVPVVENNSRSDIYEAEIELDLGTTFFGFDTFRFEVKMKDRSLNMSNTTLSPTQFSFSN